MWNIGRYSKKKDGWWQLSVALCLITILFIWKAIIESWHLLFCIVCLVLWVSAYYLFLYLQKKSLSRPASLWKVYSKKYPIIIQYSPPKWINPAEAWLLYNCSVESTDLTSLIYQRKFEKLIDIKTFIWKNSKREYIKLIKLDDMPLTRPLFESEIFDSIFRMWDVKIIEWAFQLRYALMLEDLEYHWIQKWWVYRKKSEIKPQDIDDKSGESSMTLVLYLFVLFLFFLIEYVEIPYYIWFLIIVFWIIAWAIIYWKSYLWWNLKFTEKWAKLASEIIGYSQFIKSCDENKIKLFLEEDPLFIDRTLPYATAFWMETEFLKKISPLQKDWNAKYLRWKKVPAWVSVINFFTRDDDSLL